MLSTWSALPLDKAFTAQVVRHPTATIAQILAGSATGGADITAFCESISQSVNEVSIRLKWHMELYDPALMPRADEVLEIKLNGQILWVGIIQSISGYGEKRGERTMSLVARSRDATPFWRSTKITTQVYSLSTDLTSIIEDLLVFLKLISIEKSEIPSLGAYTVHTSTQIAETSAWDAITTILQVGGYEPYVDALGRFKAISRSLDRTPTHVIDAGRFISINASNNRASVTKMRLKWLDPNLTKTTNAERVLAGATITAGFFQLKQEQDIFFSDDRTQRAENTRLVIKQTCNSGLIQVASEEYEPLTQTGGKITLETALWVPVLATASLIAMQATGGVGDVAPPSGGITLTVGRRIHAAAEATILLIMMSIGTGVYEVWGTPFDYVHATNTTIAVDSSAPEWSEQIEDIANDFVMNEAMAQAIAIRELLYANLSANNYNFSIVDDPSIERGDILQMPDGSRIYVTGYSRELSRGAAHILQVDGFRV